MSDSIADALTDGELDLLRLLADECRLPYPTHGSEKEQEPFDGLLGRGLIARVPGEPVLMYRLTIAGLTLAREVSP